VRRSLGYRRAALLASLLVGVLLAACGGGGASEGEEAVGSAGGGEGEGRVAVVTTVAPLRSIIENVAGDRARVTALVPEGANSHTFEPPPSAAELLAEADLIVLNGLQLELPTLELARANADEERLLLLGDRTIRSDEYVFDSRSRRAMGIPIRTCGRRQR